MNFDIGAIFGQFVSFFTRLPLAQKIALPLLIAGSVGVIVFVSRWANRPEYAVMYSGLQEGDASAVVERLKDQKVGFRLRDDGRTVEVTPPELVSQLRLELASAGLPKNGTVGYELFNENSLGRTGFVDKVYFIRAIQGELERTILSIDAVRSVRVHITAPEKSVFVKRDILPTASVFLRLKAGSELTPQQVKGIAHFVANSVERLTPDNVTIMDSNGNILNQKTDSEGLLGGESTQLEYRHRLESDLAKRVESMLIEVIGPGKAVARVAADIDFSKFEKEEESYDPGGQVVRSTRVVQEAGGLTAEGGVPGVVSNLTNDPGLLTPPDSAKNSNNRQERVSNYEISRAVSKTTAAIGSIKKLSVAVLIDGRYIPIAGAAGAEAATPGVSKQYQPLGPEMLKRLENLVKQAVGFDAARGDIVTVENIQFFEPEGALNEELNKADRQNLLWNAASWGASFLVIFLFFFVVMKPLIRFLISPSEAEADLSRLLPAGIEELEAELDAERSRLTTPREIIEPTINIEELEELLAENSRLVKDSPQQAALLIRYWLNDGRV